MEPKTSIEINSKSSEVLELSDEDPDFSDEEDFDDDDDLNDSGEQAKMGQKSEAGKGMSIRMKLENLRKQQKIQIQESKEISDFYIIKEKIGEGGFGKVYRAIEKKSNLDRAIKLIYKKDISYKKQLLSETDNLKQLDHPNIIKLYEHYESRTKVFIVQELLKGEELYQRLEKTQVFDEGYSRKIFKQILEAVNYIHKHGVAHRDLKPQNFIFEDEKSDNLKLIDFGLSSIYIPKLDNGASQKSTKSLKSLQNMKTIVGTSWYIAPEVYQQRYSALCDIWSAGVILFIMLVGYPPFFGENEREIKYAVLTQSLKFDDDGGWDNISKEAMDLLSKMICKEDQRLNAQQCLDHPWFKSELIGEQKVSISLKTVDRLKNFQFTNDLKRAILLFIAYHSNSKDEIRKYQKIFLAIDQKKNGYVSLDDINKLLSPYLESAVIKKVFQSIDADKNGKIYWNEFLAATLSQQIYLKEENLRQAFNYLDKEQKGYFGLRELKEVLQDPDGQVTDGQFKKVFEDAFPHKRGNQDIQISYTDFKSMMEHLAL